MLYTLHAMKIFHTNMASKDCLVHEQIYLRNYTEYFLLVIKYLWCVAGNTVIILEAVIRRTINSAEVAS